MVAPLEQSRSAVRRSSYFILALLVVAALPLLSYPLSWLPSRIASYRYIVLLPVGPLLACGTLMVLGGGLLRGRCLRVQRAILWPVSALALSWLLSVQFSQHQPFSVRLLPVFLGNLAAFWLGLGFPRARRMELGWCWLTAAVLVAVNGLTRMGNEPDWASTVGNRNFLGAYLAASVMIGIGLPRRARDARPADGESVRGQRLQRWAVLAGVGTLLAAMVFCRSRGAWLALGGALFLCFLGCRRGRWKWVALTWVLVSVLAAAGFFVFSSARAPWGGDVRPLIWQGTLKMVAERPVIGHGLGTFVVEYPRFRLPEYFTLPKAANLTDHAHNELLETATEQGILGLVVTLWLWGAAFGLGWRQARNSGSGPLGLDWAFTGAATVFVLHSMVDVDLRFAPNQTLLWLLLGLLANGEGAGIGPDPMRVRSRLLRWLPALACSALLVWIGVTAVINPLRAAIWDRHARLAADRGDLSATITGAQRSLAIDPWRLDTRYFLAGILARVPHATARQSAIKQSLEIQSLAGDYADITFNLGQLYMADQRPREALPHLVHAVDLNPYDASRRYLLALALVQTGLRDEARGQLQEALRLNPADGPSWGLLAELQKEARP